MQVVRHRRSRLNYGKLAVAGARLAYRHRGAISKFARGGLEKLRSLGASAGPQGTRVSPPTTYQHDTKLVYKRRRVPKRVARRAMRSRNVFRNHMAQMLGVKRFIKNQFGQFGGIGNQQTFAAVEFFNSRDVSDCFQLFGVGNGSLPPNAAASNALFTGDGQAIELYFKQCRIEMEILNSGSALCYVDIYHYYPRKDYSISVQAYINRNLGNNDGGAMFFDPTGAITQTNVVVSDTPGVTPFDIPSFVENFVVTRTRRVLLQAGQAFVFDVTVSPGNQSSKDWIGLVGRRSITRGVIIVGQGVVSSSTLSTSAVSLRTHMQLTASLYRQGGTGNRSQTAVSLGNTT